jgi:anti-sigma-K factor RskA
MSEHDNFYDDIAAYMLGALDREDARALEHHAEDCERCRHEIRWLSVAVRALPETVERQTPPPALRERVMAEVRADAASAAAVAPAAERGGERAGLGAWLRGLHVGGLTWKPLAGMAVVVLVVAAFAGYEAGNNGGGSSPPAPQISQVGPQMEPSGIAATVVRNGDRGSIHLTGVETLPKGHVLEAWVQRGETIEPVRALFVPDARGNASTQIADLDGVEKVMVTREPAGGTKAPTSPPIAAVALD